MELDDDVRARNRLWNLEREIATLQITQANEENKQKEAQLHHLIHQNTHKINGEISPRKGGDFGVGDDACEASTGMPDYFCLFDFTKNV